MVIGRINQLQVKRESDIAYVLTDGLEEIFLHKKEALEPYVNGQTIEVFLYIDNVGRITASTKTPLATIDIPGWLEVVSIEYQYGIFLHYGLVKDVLLSKDDLPLQLEKWPTIGDQLYCILKEKKQQLFAKQVSRKSHKLTLTPTASLEEHQQVEAFVVHLLAEGLVLLTKEGHEIFVHYNNTRKSYRLGEKVLVRILRTNANDEYIGSLIGQKERMLDQDSERVLTYLKNHQGTMRFTDQSSPEEIQAAFQMSKGAFKRALGTLYKSGQITLEPTQTKLK